MTKLLLDLGALPHLGDNRGRIALHLAYFPTVSKALIDGGADVNQKDLEGETPLIYHTRHHHYSINCALAKVLLDEGALISASCHQGRTAWYWAKAYGNQALMRLLRRRGAICDGDPGTLVTNDQVKSTSNGKPGLYAV